MSFRKTLVFLSISIFCVPTTTETLDEEIPQSNRALGPSNLLEHEEILREDPTREKKIHSGNSTIQYVSEEALSSRRNSPFIDSNHVENANTKKHDFPKVQMLPGLLYRSVGNDTVRRSLGTKVVEPETFLNRRSFNEMGGGRRVFAYDNVSVPIPKLSKPLPPPGPRPVIKYWPPPRPQQQPQPEPQPRPNPPPPPQVQKPPPVPPQIQKPPPQTIPQTPKTVIPPGVPPNQATIQKNTTTNLSISAIQLNQTINNTAHNEQPKIFFFPPDKSTARPNIPIFGYPVDGYQEQEDLLIIPGAQYPSSFEVNTVVDETTGLLILDRNQMMIMISRISALMHLYKNTLSVIRTVLTSLSESTNEDLYWALKSIYEYLRTKGIRLMIEIPALPPDVMQVSKVQQLEYIFTILIKVLPSVHLQCASKNVIFKLRNSREVAATVSQILASTNILQGIDAGSLQTNYGQSSHVLGYPTAAEKILGRTLAKILAQLQKLKTPLDQALFGWIIVNLSFISRDVVLKESILYIYEKTIARSVPGWELISSGIVFRDVYDLVFTIVERITMSNGIPHRIREAAVTIYFHLKPKEISNSFVDVSYCFNERPLNVQMVLSAVIKIEPSSEAVSLKDQLIKLLMSNNHLAQSLMPDRCEYADLHDLLLAAFVKLRTHIDESSQTIRRIISALLPYVILDKHNHEPSPFTSPDITFVDLINALNDPNLGPQFTGIYVRVKEYIMTSPSSFRIFASFLPEYKKYCSLPLPCIYVILQTFDVSYTREIPKNLLVILESLKNLLGPKMVGLELPPNPKVHPGIDPFEPCTSPECDRPSSLWGYDKKNALAYPENDGPFSEDSDGENMNINIDKILPKKNRGKLKKSPDSASHFKSSINFRWPIVIRYKHKYPVVTSLPPESLSIVDIQLPPIKDLLRPPRIIMILKQYNPYFTQHILMPISNILGPNKYVFEIFNDNLRNLIQMGKFPTMASLIYELVIKAKDHPLITDTQIRPLLEKYLWYLELVSHVLVIAVVSFKNFGNDVIYSIKHPGSDKYILIDQCYDAQVQGTEVYPYIHPSYWYDPVNMSDPYSTLLPTPTNVEHCGNSLILLRKIFDRAHVSNLIPGLNPLYAPNKITLLLTVLFKLREVDGTMNNQKLRIVVTAYLKALIIPGIYADLTHQYDIFPDPLPNYITRLMELIPTPTNPNESSWYSALIQFLQRPDLFSILELQTPNPGTDYKKLLALVLDKILELHVFAEIKNAAIHYVNKLYPERAKNPLKIVQTQVFVYETEVNLGLIMENVIDYSHLPNHLQIAYNEFVEYLVSHSEVLQGNNDFHLETFKSQGQFMRGLMNYLMRKRLVPERVHKLIEQLLPHIKMTGSGNNEMPKSQRNKITNTRKFLQESENSYDEYAEDE